MFRDVRERHDSAMCFSPLSVSFPHPPILRSDTFAHASALMCMQRVLSVGLHHPYDMSSLLHTSGVSSTAARHARHTLLPTAANGRALSAHA